MRLHGSEEGADGGDVGDVEGVDETLSAQRLDFGLQRFQLRQRTAANRDSRTGAHGVESDRATDATSRSGDDDGLTGQFKTGQV